MDRAFPSKQAGEENFPVASFLTPVWARDAIRNFYTFARTGDDIADDPSLKKEEKLARLDALRASLSPERQIFGGDLIKAFVQDVYKNRYSNWDELLAYCALSAAPVGHFFLDLYGERDWRAKHAVDALCAALQILNHLQDCGDDYKTLDRVYIPEPWFSDECVSVAALGEDRSTPGLKKVFDRVLIDVEALLDDAMVLPRVVKGRRLAMEAGVFVAVGRGLVWMLMRKDPLSQRVALSRIGFGLAVVFGGLWGLIANCRKIQ
ncbi:MAG: squalene/phytoene synthase family protein [Rhodospirillales bacterium]|jgi:phytoene/squalene synthetase|nr:squalene/phytoene synthase family protein [Rhodospirillales bacterium]MBT4006354.1 squalene/phytoene synthase family protein [Rhodospirillales bacterium]MBT5075863.1 squalene/phytoene synthase family protein [Rhodospirillales bacterium]MBT5114231.1 squalene/phytoene synthase family protein [Rhodospirillales bacterium]MBT5673101.1 squalene/phytoene synthase family protein [Rhodospirillales bacterium]